MEQILDIFNPWWHGPFSIDGTIRPKYMDALTAQRARKDVVFITGLRRVGKTTLVKQYIERMLRDGTPPERILYFSMDHPGLVKESLLDVLDAYRRMHSLAHDDAFTAFIDEVHMRPGFERELKTIYDLGNVKVYATGSSSIFLVERGAFLTGRQTFLEVLPFSFSEYLGILGKGARPGDAHLKVRYAEEYVREGGLPEFLATRDPGYITTLLDSILYKDLAARHGIRNVGALKDMLMMISQATGSRVSTRKMARALGISHETVAEHLSFFIECNLVRTVKLKGKTTASVASPKKVYLADTGMAFVLTPTVNLGSLVETAVLNHLRQTPGEIGYLIVDGKEIDFVSGGICVEVKYRDDVARDDVAHMLNAHADRRLVVTRSQSGNIDGIELVPLWRFLTDGPDFAKTGNA